MFAAPLPLSNHHKRSFSSSTISEFSIPKSLLYPFHHTPPTTPPGTSSEESGSTPEQIFLSEVQFIYNELTILKSLAPSPKINSLLTQLVQLCITPKSDIFTHNFFSLPGADALCQSLRPLCASAEGELESFWAGKLLLLDNPSLASSENKADLLSHFPYHQNYIDLSKLETSILSAFLPQRNPENIAFIGSGPMPLTSFCMLDTYPNAVVHNIDRDEPALEISRKISEKLGYSGGMTFANEDVTVDGGKTEWEKFDVVFLAALVGMDSESKVGILGALARKLGRGTVVVVRSARGVRGVLYPVVEISKGLLEAGYEVLAEVHPWTKVVNSVVVLRVK